LDFSTVFIGRNIRLLSSLSSNDYWNGAAGEVDAIAIILLFFDFSVGQTDPMVPIAAILRLAHKRNHTEISKLIGTNILDVNRYCNLTLIARLDTTHVWFS
jgi:hypothetical protein